MNIQDDLLYGKDARDLLSRWDAGQSIFTVEMGGLGPGYEQAIQILVMEIIRDEKDNPLPEDKYNGWGDKAVSRIDDEIGGFSGAQVGAAKYLAFRLLKDGPQKCFETLKEQGKGDRLIQVSKNFPAMPVMHSYTDLEEGK